MELSLVSALSPRRVIGAGDALPWSIPEEYRHFLDLVRGHPLFMGRKSEEIFGTDLPESPRWVVSRSAGDFPGARHAPSVEAAVRAVLADARARGLELAFCAGGGSIYRAALPLANRMDLSFVEVDPDGDTFFPEWDDDDWTVEEESDRGSFVYRRFRRVAGGVPWPD